ncbi:hypothetical protein RIF29_11123 [Crotalaria pallida]|uniref:Uncharacterized protein n=1 Tax=Crotalaria pallida TaxID=3830 RepID=A0AAN9FWI0_CROPI
MGKKRQQKQRYVKKASNTMPLVGNSLPKEWEGKTDQLPFQWEDVLSKKTKIQLEKNGYKDSLFMFEDNIVPLPSKLAEDVSRDSLIITSSYDDALIEEQKKELMQQVDVFANHVMYAPRDSKPRLQVFKDIYSPN